MKRNGLRSPWAMIRRAFASEFEKSGFEGSAAPVVGSTRMIEPSSVTGSPAVRRSWLRSAPPSERGIRAWVDRTAVLSPVDEIEAGAIACAGVQGAVRPELDRPGRVRGVLLAPVLDQHLLGAGHHVAGGLQAREAAAHDAAVRGRGRAGSDSRPRRARRLPQRGAVPPIAASCV